MAGGRGPGSFGVPRTSASTFHELFRVPLSNFPLSPARSASSTKVASFRPLATFATLLRISVWDNCGLFADAPKVVAPKGFLSGWIDRRTFWQVTNGSSANLIKITPRRKGRKQALSQIPRRAICCCLAEGEICKKRGGGGGEEKEEDLWPFAVLTLAQRFPRPWVKSDKRRSRGLGLAAQLLIELHPR